MNPLNLFGSLSSALGIMDIMKQSPIERAARLAQEAQVRQQEQAKKTKDAVDRDQARRRDLESQVQAAKTKMARVPPDQQSQVAGQISMLESQLSAMDQMAQNPVRNVPQTGDGKAAPTPQGPADTTTETSRIEQQFNDVSVELEKAKAENKSPEKIFSLELKQDFLRQALTVAKSDPAVLRSQPSVLDGMTKEELKSELSQLDWALEELGTGHELAMDPEKLELAQELRQERDRLLFHLAQSSGETGKTVRSGGAEGLEQAQQVNEVPDPWESKDPKIKAFLANHYGDSQSLPSIAKPDPELLAKNVTHEKAEKLAEKLITDLGILPATEDQHLSRDDREKLGKLRSMAYNQLHANVSKANPLEAASSGLMKQYLSSQEGTQMLRKEVTTLAKESRESGAMNPGDAQRLDRVLKNTFDPAIKDKVEMTFIRNPNADIKQVAKEIFLDASRQAQGRGARRTMNPQILATPAQQPQTTGTVAGRPSTFAGRGILPG